MRVEQISNLFAGFGRGLLIGIGIGAALFGVLFLTLSIKKGQDLNLGAMMSIFSGSFCIIMGLAKSKRKYNKPIKQD
jgi:hypothetical protein